MNTITQLQTVFGSNFLAYFRSHVAHINITGRNFTSDHALLGEIYEHLQEQIDTIGELIRTYDETVPDTLDDVVSNSTVTSKGIFGTAETLLGEVSLDLQSLKRDYEVLIEVSTQPEDQVVSNYAQDQLLAINKFLWKLNSTLE